jgi:hypothetical protein
MCYSVRDFMVALLSRWLYNEEHPLKGAKYAVVAFVQLLMNAAQAKDYVESVSGIDPGLPNVDTLFWRLGECATFDLILQEYKKIVKRSIEAVKKRIRRMALTGFLQQTSSMIRSAGTFGIIRKDGALKPPSECTMR